MRRGLVLGGGGPVGTAWYAGLVRGLVSGGVDLAPDVVVGTSAGAVAGAWLCSGAEADEFVAAVVGSANDRGRADLSRGLDAGRVLEVYGMLGAASAPLEPADVLALCDAAGDGDVPTTDFDSSVQLWARSLPDVDWPPALLVAVVDVATGELRLLGAHDDVPLAVAVAASAAAPGIRAPVPIGGGTFVDGGARSSTNADTLVGLDVDRALVIVPVPADTPLIGEATQRVLAEELRRLRAADIRVRVVAAGSDDGDAFGPNLLDLSATEPAIEAGFDRGRREATELAAWW